ncbi:natural killer cell receptor 2B4-like [Osmerus mordax]|uniref:natural killer cell receptor 2B4-like n=1 Tax=Osmerus mordax TaxID=8014 RepID=UPI00350F3D89
MTQHLLSQSAMAHLIWLKKNRFHGRITPHKHDGSITIVNMKTNDSGVFSLHILPHGSNRYYNIKVHGKNSHDDFEKRRVKVGESTTLDTYLDTDLCSETQCQDYDLQWWYSPIILQSFTWIARWQNNISKTDYNDHFKDTLQMDLRNGCLTLRNITTNHSGYYHLEKLKARQSENHSLYEVIVNDEVSRPSIHSFLSLSADTDTCTVECSVENGRDVTLFWYRGEERLNQTSSPDLSRVLSLPLEIKNQDGDTYSCVAENPVSNKTANLNKTELCPDPPSQKNTMIVVGSVIGSLFVICVICVLCQSQGK